MSDVGVNVGRSAATGWPTIDQLSTFTGVSATDEALLWALDGAVDYGNLVLSNRFSGPVNASIFRACLDYAGSIYVERVGQADLVVEGWQGSSPQQRYRRILLSNRFVAIA